MDPIIDHTLPDAQMFEVYSIITIDKHEYMRVDDGWQSIGQFKEFELVEFDKVVDGGCTVIKRGRGRPRKPRKRDFVIEP